MALTENQVEELIKKVTGDVLQEEKQLDLQTFIIVCKNYIQAIQQQLKTLENRYSLMERVVAIGRFMHDDISGMQRMLVLSHSFELAFNNFLGRQIPLTWVTETGNILIGSEQTIIQLYASARSAVKKSNTSGRIYTGKIKGIRQDMFNKKLLNSELKDLQQKINDSAMNKKAAFQQSKRRYNKSSKMEYAKQNESLISNIYWNADTSDGNPKHWSKKIASAGYIGEGYVAMVLNMAHQKAIAIYPQQPPYDKISQSYIEYIATAASLGDAIPGIIQGDIKANDSGTIQLAIKQGYSFSAASISGNVAIAYAFLLTPQTELLQREEIQKQLDIMGKEWKSASWDRIFQAISKQVAAGIQITPMLINLI